MPRRFAQAAALAGLLLLAGGYARLLANPPTAAQAPNELTDLTVHGLLKVEGDLQLPRFRNALYTVDGDPKTFNPDCQSGQNVQSDSATKNWGEGAYFDHCGVGNLILGDTIFTRLNNAVNVVFQRGDCGNADHADDPSQWTVVATCNLVNLVFRGFHTTGGFASSPSASISVRATEDYTDNDHSGAEIRFHTTPNGVGGEVRERLAIQQNGVIRTDCVDATPSGHPDPGQLWQWYDCATYAYKVMDSSGTVVTLAQFPMPSPTPTPTPTPTPEPCADKIPLGLSCP